MAEARRRKSSGMLAALLLAAALLPELEVALGAAGAVGPDAPDSTPLAFALRVRAGVELSDHFTLSAALLGMPGSEAQQTSCDVSCYGNGSFKAISGLALLRAHTAGDLQFFLEGGIGAGHLISLSGDDLFQNPAEHGRGALAYWLGGGGRWFAKRQVALGF